MSEYNKNQALVILKNKIKEETKTMVFWISRLDFNLDKEHRDELSENITFRLKEVIENVDLLQKFISGEIDKPFGLYRDTEGELPSINTLEK